MFSPVHADSVNVKLRLISTPQTLIANLDFKDMVRPGGQTLSIIVTNNLDALISGANINANITLPNGTIVNASFVETTLGNYTYFYNFTDIGDYPINVFISKSGFISPISGGKTITVGLVKFIDFTSDSNVVFGSTIHFKFSAKNIGNVSSIIIPEFSIYNSTGDIVFSKYGFPSTLDANLTASLIQFSVMSWVASAPPGVYNASGRILFTDPDNISAYTQNKTLLFTILPAPTVPGGPPSGGGGGTLYPIINKTIQNQTYPLNITPGIVREFLFANLPILTEAYPGDSITVPLEINNPYDKPISSIRISIEGLPSRWYSIGNNEINTNPGETKLIPITFTIPNNAEIGNHFARFVVEDNEIRKDALFILRINQKTDQYPALTYENAKTSETLNTTTSSFHIKNGNTNFESVEIFIRIDKGFAKNISEINFFSIPANTRGADSIVEFDFSNVKPSDEINISYFTNKMVFDITPFIYSSIEQIHFVERKPIILPSALVEDKFIYTILIILIIVIILLIIIYIRQRRKMKESIKEAKRAVWKVSEENKRPGNSGM